MVKFDKAKYAAENQTSYLTQLPPSIVNYNMYNSWQITHFHHLLVWGYIMLNLFPACKQQEAQANSGNVARI